MSREALMHIISVQFLLVFNKMVKNYIIDKQCYLRLFASRPTLKEQTRDSVSDLISLFLH